jgi:hypothetical protein
MGTGLVYKFITKQLGLLGQDGSHFHMRCFPSSYFLIVDKSPAIYRSFPCRGNLGTFGGLVRDGNRPIRLRYPLSPNEANHVWHVINERHLCLIYNIFRIMKNQLSARKQQVKWDRQRPYTCYRSISLSRKILQPKLSSWYVDHNSSIWCVTWNSLLQNFEVYSWNHDKAIRIYAKLNHSYAEFRNPIVHVNLYANSCSCF